MEFAEVDPCELVDRAPCASEFPGHAFASAATWGFPSRPDSHPRSPTLATKEWSDRWPSSVRWGVRDSAEARWTWRRNRFAVTGQRNSDPLAKV